VTDALDRAPAGGLVRALQERAARALPASRIAFEDGWWLRHTQSRSWWAGSVLPHGPMRDLGRVEAFYARFGAPARFQISPDVAPDGLDAALAGRGYRRFSPMSLRVASVASVLDRFPGDARLTDRPPDAWSAVHADLGPADRDLLRRVRPPSVYAAVDDVSVGRAVLDDGWAGVFGMATVPAGRGRGAARRVLATLARWAADHGADRLYLQVEPDNTAAGRLYTAAGFTELYGYHYRVSVGPCTSSPGVTRGASPSGPSSSTGSDRTTCTTSCDT